MPIVCGFVRVFLESRRQMLVRKNIHIPKVMLLAMAPIGDRKGYPLLLHPARNHLMESACAISDVVRTRSTKSCFMSPNGVRTKTCQVYFQSRGLGFMPVVCDKHFPLRRTATAERQVVVKVVVKVSIALRDRLFLSHSKDAFHVAGYIQIYAFQSWDFTTHVHNTRQPIQAKFL